MRKLILFFTSLSVILFFTSCLKAGDSSFSGQEEFFYITRQDGLQMAYNGNFAMTSAEIKAKSEINRWYRITWTWSTPNGMAAENANVHNAVTSQVEAVPLGAPLQTGGGGSRSRCACLLFRSNHLLSHSGIVRRLPHCSIWVEKERR